MICSSSLGFEGVTIIGKISGSVQLSTMIVSLLTDHHYSFTKKTIDKENMMKLPLANQRKEVNFQIHTEHFREEKELAFGVGTKKGLEKEKAPLKSHLPPSRGMQKLSAQSFPLKENQRHSISMDRRNTPYEGEVVRMEVDLLVINEKDSNFVILRRDEEGRHFIDTKEIRDLTVLGKATK